MQAMRHNSAFLFSFFLNWDIQVASLVPIQVVWRSYQVATGQLSSPNDPPHDKCTIQILTSASAALFIKLQHNVVSVGMLIYR